jgi:uncharacterized membrane protein YeaQ/YmgE (transglycosylase-associated protein family)
MRKLFMSVLFLTGALSFGGCTVVGATANVIGAAGTLVGVTANVAAGAVGAVVGGAKKSDCADESDDKGDCKKKPARN